MPDEQARRDAAEHLALALTDGGMQRMTARVLCAYLLSPQETLTAGELGAELGVSAGSVSGAVRALVSVGLVERVPAPGSRRDHHRLRSGAWATLFTSQNATLDVMRAAAERGMESTGADSPAGRRLVEMRDFYAFLLAELPAVLDRWHTRP